MPSWFLVRTSRAAALLAFALSPIAPVSAAGQTSAAADTAVSTKVWLTARQNFEDYLRVGEIVGMKEVPVGITKPMRCQFAPGGPIAEMAWKPIRPGRYNGFYESYKNEIAAYELDKLLE